MWSFPIDFAANAAGLGPHTSRATTREDLEESRRQDRTPVIVVDVDGEEHVPGSEARCDASFPKISEIATVRRLGRITNGPLPR